MGRKIPLASLFRGSTVASLAKLLREGSESDPEPLVVEFQAGNGGSLPFFAVAAPGVRSLGYAILARHLGENQPFYKLQAAGSDFEGRPLSLQSCAGSPSSTSPGCVPCSRRALTSSPPCAEAVRSRNR